VGSVELKFPAVLEVSGTTESHYGCGAGGATPLSYFVDQRDNESGEKTSMDGLADSSWRELLTLLLAQRLEVNAIESALKAASVLTETQIREIRTQASDTAKAWSSKNTDDVLTLLRVHSSPLASMSVPPISEQ
jgi:hypothetical protein